MMPFDHQMQLLSAAQAAAARVFQQGGVRVAPALEASTEHRMYLSVVMKFTISAVIGTTEDDFVRLFEHFRTSAEAMQQ